MLVNQDEAALIGRSLFSAELADEANGTRSPGGNC
jgi:hypothetical protein